MTNLERLIKAHVEGTTVTTVAVATEKLAEEMARAILKDPAWRLRMRQLIERHAPRRRGRKRTIGT